MPGSRRLELHALLIAILGAQHVYFQPPSTVEMQYPCIVYRRSNAMVLHADNAPYHRRQGYQITIIDANPDSEIPVGVYQLPLCKFDRHYTADNLNHDVFNMYY